MTCFRYVPGPGDPPRWLVEALYCNQQLGAALGLLFVGGLLAAAYAYTKIELTEGEKIGMLRNGGTVMSIIIATTALGKMTNNYPVIVAGGFLIGYSAWTFLLGPRVIKAVGSKV